MIDKKGLFLNGEIRCGGFYELSIQVCPSLEMEPVKIYTDFIWSLENVDGPFDKSFNKIKTDIDNNGHEGILNLDQYSIPFRTYNIREEEPLESGFNLFDIYFYTAAIEKVFGEEFKTWTENPKLPKQLEDFLNRIIEELYKLYPFRLAILDYEVSGQYYLEDLKSDLKGWTPSRFFVGLDNYKLIAENNKKLVTIIG